MASSGTKAESSGPAVDVIKDSYIPIFNNRPGDYREYRARVLLYKQKMDLQKRPKEATINLLTSLSDIAWRQVEHLASSAPEASDGFDQVLRVLDKTFKYDDRVEMPKAIDRFFYQLGRRNEQTLMSYTADYREAYRDLQKHKITLPDAVCAWILLKRSGLSAEQRQMVMTQVGTNMTEANIEEAFYLLYGQDYRGRASFGNTSKGKGKGSKSWYPRRNQAYNVSEIDEIYEAADDTAYYENAETFDPEDDEFPDYDEDFEGEDAFEYHEVSPHSNAFEDGNDGYYEYPEGEDPEAEEAYASYLDARRRFAEIKSNRGFWPVVAMPPDAASPSSSQRPFTPSSSPSRKGSSKSGKGYGGKNRYTNRPPPQKGDAKSRGKAASGTTSTICYKCHQPGHTAINCPKNSNNSPSTSTKRPRPSHSINMVREQQHTSTPTIPTTPTTGYFATQDGGASSMVAGHNIVMGYVDYLIQKGIKIDDLQFRLCDKTFHFGGDRELHSEWSVHLPVWIANKYGRLQCFIVEGNTPMLLGRPILKALKVKVNYDDDTYSVDGSPWQSIPTGDKKEHLIQLDFGIDPKHLGTEPQFDLMTTDTFDIIHYDNQQDTETYNIHYYLQHTDRSPPEHILNTNDTEQHDNTPQNQQDNLNNDIIDDEEDHYTVKKMITDKLVCSFKTHLASTNNRQRHVMEQILRAHDGRKLQFWEVYAGSGNLAEAMRRKGYDVKTFDINNGWDFTQASHRRALLKLHYEQMPDLVWIAPPCTKWSPLQRINVQTPEQAEALQADRDFEEHTHLKLTEQLHTRQRRSGRHALAEQPQRADSWKTDTFQAMDGYDATVHQCQYGATMLDEAGTEQYIRKATTLRATDQELANALTRICPGDHYHLPIEGSSPGIGNRAAASAQYSPDMCCHWANIMNNFMKQHYTPTAEQAYEGDDDEAPADNMQLDTAAEETEETEQQAAAPNTGILTRLQENTKQAAQRTAHRLHRNLGHPTNKELQNILQKKGASNTLLEAVDSLHCDLCYRHRPPPQPPKSNLKSHSDFNSRVLADTMWIQLSTGHSRPIPVLTVIDSSTKLMAARVLNSEQTSDFISTLERGWVRHFGPPHTLQIDEARGWSSEALRSWSSDHGIFLEISPGQAHTRLSVLERRHQVLRRAVELFVQQHLQQHDVEPRAAIETALIYVVPQINNVPNIHGYSATQWAFGQNPKLPGHLMDPDLTIAQLTPSQQMQEKLQLKQQAATAVIQADNDMRLRRALLRQHQAQHHTYSTGQQVFYWRDAPGGAGPKIRWKGPAVVVMVEDGRAGPLTNIYWIAHGTTLLRASGEHLRPHLDHSDQPDTTPLSRAQQALDNIRGRSTTLYIDLNKTNKRKREEVTTEDEEEENAEDFTDLIDTEMVPAQDDYWDISEDGITWTRVHVKQRRELYTPQHDPQAPWQQFRTDRLTLIRRLPPYHRAVIRDDWTESDSNRDMTYQWTGTTTFTLRSAAATTTPTMAEDTTMTPSTATNQQQPTTHAAPTPIITEADNIHDNTLPPIPETPATIPSLDTSEPHFEPDPSQLNTPRSNNNDDNMTPPLPVPPDVTALYQPQQPGETFEQLRSRYQQQETLYYRQPQYGPALPVEPTSNRATPYNTPQRPNINTPNAEADVAEVSYTGYDADVLDGTTMSLPPGWTMEHGYLTLEEPRDECSIKDGWLVRRHYVPRRDLFDPETNTEATCPVPLSYLTKDRVTKTQGRTAHDQWTKHRNSGTDFSQHPWTGTTKFKIHQTHRQQAREQFYNVSDGHITFTQPQTTTHTYKPTPKTKPRKDQLSEKNMSTADRLAFWEAKKKELESFFQNDVWTYDDAENATPGRTLKGHFILKWSKWPSGLPRAKARFITQGFRDPDALEGKINTESPTLSRISRNYILTVAATKQWTALTADISTAFLQGKEHHKDRTLWISLPADAGKLLGIPAGSNKVMKLRKPMYGLCDAPRAWFLEARERLTNLGAEQHPLDACLFLLYDYQAPHSAWTHRTDSKGAKHRHPPLIALMGIHVDDIIAAVDKTNKTYQTFEHKLKQAFTFRTWEEDKDFDYCGAQVRRLAPDHYTLEHQQYLTKQKPITIDNKDDDDRPVTEKERSSLRALIGALQWPAGQSSPHLQAAISQLAGQVSKATVATLREANKALRYAKSNSDVCLHFTNIGSPSDLTFITYCDAAFASRPDNTSQGGYLVMLVHHSVTTGQEGSYNLVDWRSWKLPRVARSSLSAESQAASEAADAMLYCSTFWQLLWTPLMPLDDFSICKPDHPTALITDAKGLYDLLVKQELQPSSGADKRTAIEVLVAQDKLLCTGAKVKWVSSELQFADGMTKTAAGLLLAQRLRTHRTRIKPDSNFTASKKKDPAMRKRSAEQFALKKPAKQLQSMIAFAYFTQQCTANTTTTAIYTDTTFTTSNFLTAILIILFIHAITSLWNAMTRTMSSLWSSTMTRSLRSMDALEPQTVEEAQTEEKEIQTESPEEEECVQCLRWKDWVDEITRNHMADHASVFREHETNLDAARRGKLQAVADRDRLQDRLNQSLETIKKLKEQQVADRKRFETAVDDHVISGLQRGANREIYVTPHGKVWHSSINCLQPQYHAGAMKKQPCKMCAHMLAPRPNREVRGVLCAAYANSSSPDRRTTDD